MRLLTVARLDVDHRVTLPIETTSVEVHGVGVVVVGLVVVFEVVGLVAGGGMQTITCRPFIGLVCPRNRISIMYPVGGDGNVIGDDEETVLRTMLPLTSITLICMVPS
jgi:hypothetical protein